MSRFQEIDQCNIEKYVQIPGKIMISDHITRIMEEYNYTIRNSTALHLLNPYSDIMESPHAGHKFVDRDFYGSPNKTSNYPVHS